MLLLYIYNCENVFVSFIYLIPFLLFYKILCAFYHLVSLREQIHNTRDKKKKYEVKNNERRELKETSISFLYIKLFINSISALSFCCCCFCKPLWLSFPWNSFLFILDISIYWFFSSVLIFFFAQMNPHNNGWSIKEMKSKAM